MTEKEAKKQSKKKKERLRPISLYPLEIEEALGDILSIKPKGKKGNSDVKGDD